MNIIDEIRSNRMPSLFFESLCASLFPNKPAPRPKVMLGPDGGRNFDRLGKSVSDAQLDAAISQLGKTPR